MNLLRCTFRVDPELTDALTGCLFDHGCTGLEETAAGEIRTYVPTRAAAEELLQAYAEFLERARLVFPEAQADPAEVEEIDDSWQTTWLQALEPVALTERWVLRPTTRRPAPPGESTLWFEPNPSFGAGDHPTTQLAARALEREGQERPGQTLLDVGCGNGVLCLLALQSGFSRASALDVEQEAVQGTQTNLELNELTDRVEVQLGSADSTDELFPVVVANIDAPTLLQLSASLFQRVAPGGRCFLTGLLTEDRAEILACYTKLGAVLLREQELQGWSLLELSQPAHSEAHLG